MLHQPFLSRFAFTYDNWGANPSATPGTSVIPGASNAEGAWTQVATSGNIAQDIYWLRLQIQSGFVASQQKDHLLDIGVDPAGGTSYSPIISNIICGATGVLPQVGAQFFFPFFIKAGSSIAVRVQGNNATAGTVRVMAKFYGQSARMEALPVASFSETIGAISGSGGVGFTPGNVADGAWVSLGTTTKAMWWWQLGVQISNAAMTSVTTYTELAHGDVTNKHIITKCMFQSDGSEQMLFGVDSGMIFPQAYKPLPAGVELWVRGRANGAPATGHNAVAIGGGG